MLAGLAEAYYRTKKFSESLEIFFEMSQEFPVVRQIQEAVQGVYSMEQRSAGDVRILGGVQHHFQSRKARYL
jgi:hypothetical protein